jgi:hypothetical protein
MWGNVMKANAEVLRRIEQRAGELALIHGGQPTEHDRNHAARELLGLQTLLEPDDPVKSARLVESEQLPLWWFSPEAPSMSGAASARA